MLLLLLLRRLDVVRAVKLIFRKELSPKKKVPGFSCPKPYRSLLIYPRK